MIFSSDPGTIQEKFIMRSPVIFDVYSRPDAEAEADYEYAHRPVRFAV
jgi:hypothetical protein